MFPWKRRDRGSSTVPVDVTDELRADGHLIGEHYNEDDRVYRLGEHLVKVKTRHEPTAEHGEEVLRFSGSIVGDDGKALAREDGKLALYKFGRHLAVHAYAPTNIVRDAERERFTCVRETVSAHDHYNQIRGLTGVGRVASVGNGEAAIPAEAHEYRRALLAGGGADPGELADDVPDLDTPPPAPALDADAKHPSGRRWLLFPGHVVDAQGNARHVTAKALAAARGLKHAQCVVYRPDRAPAYYAGLEPIYPASADVDGSGDAAGAVAPSTIAEAV